MSLVRLAPERVLRSLLVTLVAVICFAPLLYLAPKTAWWQSTAFAGALLLFAGLASLRGEAAPELADSWASQRAQRYSPLAIGLLISVSLIFPTFGTWYLLWLLFCVNVALLPWTFIPRVRTVSLCVSSAAALGMTVISDAATPSLVGVALGWLLVPSLDRMGDSRLELIQRPAFAPLPTFAPASALLALGLAIFAGLIVLLPASTRGYEVIDLLAPRSSLRGGAAVDVELPSLELFVLLAMIVVLLLILNRLGGAGDIEVPLREEGSMKIGGAVPLTAEALQAATKRWPQGSRRDLVEAYLAHLRRLESLGFARTPDTTPADLATRVSRRLSPALAAASRRLAEQFARARWSRGPIAADAAKKAIEDTRTIEEALEED